jgi:DNA-binding IclR family transcriptional regulator
MHQDYTKILSFVKRLNSPRKDPAWVTISQIAEGTSLSKDRVSKLTNILITHGLLRRKSNAVSMPENWYGTGILKTGRTWLPSPKDVT